MFSVNLFSATIYYSYFHLGCNKKQPFPLDAVPVDAERQHPHRYAGLARLSAPNSELRGNHGGATTAAVLGIFSGKQGLEYCGNI